MIKKGAISAEEYYNIEGFANYSLIKGVSDSANKALLYKDKPDSIKRKKTFDAGHILERFFLEDQDLSYIKVDKTDELTGHSLKLFDYLLEHCREVGMKDIEFMSTDFALESIKDLNLWSNIKNKDILCNKIDEIWDKLKFYAALSEKDMVASADVFDIIERAKIGMKDYETVYNTLYPPEKVEIHNQYTIISDEILSIPVKGRLDRVIINHKDKTIDVIDFKTTELPAERFITAFWNFKYYYQLPFYTELFKLANPKYKDYTYSMKFVVVSKTFPEVPAVYILPNSWIEKAWGGWINKNGREMRGINSILEEIEWYWGLGGITRPYILAMRDNILEIQEDWNE